MSKNEPPSKSKQPINKVPPAMKGRNASDDDPSKRSRHPKPPSTSLIPENDPLQHVTRKQPNRTESLGSEYSANSSVKRKSNVSLPEKTTAKSDPTVSRRTSEGNVSRTRKAVKAPSTPVIPEDELPEQPTKATEFFVENETKKLRRTSSNISKISTTSGTRAVTYSYENPAFEGNQVAANDQTNNSIAGTSRANSVQSLEVYKEQYCCFVRRTRCEKCLLICVTVLAITVVVLVTVIVVLARENKLNNFLQF